MDIKKSVDKLITKDPTPQSQSTTAADTIPGLTGNTKPTTKASIADPQSKIGSIIPPESEETLTKVFTKLSNKVSIPPAVKYSKIGQILGNMDFN